MPSDNPHLNRIVEELNHIHPGMNNMAVIMHFDKTTGQLKSITPIIRASSAQELHDRLSDTAKAIKIAMDDLINKGLCNRSFG